MLRAGRPHHKAAVPPAVLPVEASGALSVDLADSKEVSVVAGIPEAPEEPVASLLFVLRVSVQEPAAGRQGQDCILVEAFVEASVPDNPEPVDTDMPVAADMDRPAADIPEEVRPDKVHFPAYRQEFEPEPVQSGRHKRRLRGKTSVALSCP